MFSRASLKLGLDRAVLQSMAVVASESGKSAQKDALSAKEVESLLKQGAYAAFDSDDARIKQFETDDIDQILQRSTTIVHGGENSAGNQSNAFSKAAFVTNKEKRGVEMDDPDFWKKMMPTAEVELAAFTDYKRKRKTVLPLQQGKSRARANSNSDSSSDEHSDSDSDASDGGDNDEDDSQGDAKAQVQKQPLPKLDDSVPTSSPWSAAQRDVVLSLLATRGYGQWQLSLQALADCANASDAPAPPMHTAAEVRALVVCFVAEVVTALDSTMILRPLLAAIRQVRRRLSDGAHLACAWLAFCFSIALLNVHVNSQI